VRAQGVPDPPGRRRVTVAPKRAQDDVAPERAQDDVAPERAPGGVAPEQRGAVDPAAVVAELEADVARRRAAGAYPPGLERELDALLARHAPDRLADAPLDELLARAEVAALVDVDVPTTSGVPGGAPAKRALRRLMAWFLAYVAQQVTASSRATVAVLGALARKVEALEAASPAVVAASLPPLDAVTPVADWVDDVVAAVRAAPADGPTRVCVSHAADGVLLDALVRAGVDAYGVEPDAASAEALAARGLDVRPGAAADHLARVGPASLLACVLAGGVEHQALGVRLQALDRALAALAPGGVLAVLSATPTAWDAAASPVSRDLAPGRPLHPETWIAVLAARGVADVRVQQHGPGPGPDAVASASAYLLVARRP
jgi:hypothetical protein